MHSVRSKDGMEDYRIVADEISADVEAGRLRPGDRLPPQRRFARERGIANSTAARVYGELVRRGVVVGEVGRGTFVRAARPPLETALAEPGGATVDLELNFAVLPEQSALVGKALEPLLREDVLTAALSPGSVSGSKQARDAVAGLIAKEGWTPEILFAGSGRQAIAAAIAAFVPMGERLAVEAITYPVVKALAGRLGVQLVPIETDDMGLIPEALEAASVRALYVQPTLHNPLGSTMDDARRVELAETVRRMDIPVIEDGIYTFLRPDVRPFATYAPERTVFADSMSKRLAPGLTTGFLAVPAAWTERLAAAVRSGGWVAPRLAVEAATRWITGGTLETVERAKRLDAAERQRVTSERLAGFTLRADPRAYHCWWELPEHWRAETFVAAAARRGIAVTPAAAFAVVPGHAPNAVRLAVSSPPLETLAAALDVLAGLASGRPEDAGVE